MPIKDLVQHLCSIKPQRCDAWRALAAMIVRTFVRFAWLWPFAMFICILMLYGYEPMDVVANRIKSSTRPPSSQRLVLTVDLANAHRLSSSYARVEIITTKLPTAGIWVGYPYRAAAVVGFDATGRITVITTTDKDAELLSKVVAIRLLDRKLKEMVKRQEGGYRAPETGFQWEVYEPRT